MRQLHSLALVALTLLALAGCGAVSPAAQPAIPPDLPPTIAVDSQLLSDSGIPSAGDVAPDFSFTMADGTLRKLSDLRGTTVLVNFWATWCTPCKEEMPDLQRLTGEYGPAVQVVGVNKLEALAAIGPFAKNLGVTFTLVANPKGDIANGYGAKNLPLTYFVKRDGTIGAVHFGVMTYDEAKAQIEQLN